DRVRGPRRDRCSYPRSSDHSRQGAGSDRSAEGMNRFEIISPRDLGHAAELLARKDHVAIAGGVDVLDLLKLDLITPQTLVNLKGLSALQSISIGSNGELRLGALVKLREVADHPTIRDRFTAFAEAAEEAATPQIRNLGTVGGNI